MKLALAIPGISTDVRPTSDEVLEALAAGSRVPLADVKRYPSGHVFGTLTAGGLVPRMIGHPDKRMAAGHPEVITELRAVRAEPIAHEGEYEEGSKFGFRLISLRMLEVYNSNTHFPSVRRAHPYNPAFMHPEDLTALGAKDGDIVIVDSGYARIKAVVQGTPDILRGVIGMAAGWRGPTDAEPNLFDVGSAVGRLISDRRLDRLSGMPLQTAIPVNVHVDAAAQPREAGGG